LTSWLLPGTWLMHSAAAAALLLLLHMLMSSALQKNTFQDFLAAARHLVDAGYTSRQGLAVWGRSAGGLTLGASLNMDTGVSEVLGLECLVV
jgi:hypothetical protein